MLPNQNITNLIQSYLPKNIKLIDHIFMMFHQLFHQIYIFSPQDNEALVTHQTLAHCDCRRVHAYWPRLPLFCKSPEIRQIWVLFWKFVRWSNNFGKFWELEKFKIKAILNSEFEKAVCLALCFNNYQAYYACIRGKGSLVVLSD